MATMTLLLVTRLQSDAFGLTAASSLTFFHRRSCSFLVSCSIHSFLKGSLSSRIIQFSAPANDLDILVFTATSPPSLSPALPSAECDIELPSAMQEVNVMLVQEEAFLCSAGKFKGPLCAPRSFIPLSLYRLWTSFAGQTSLRNVISSHTTPLQCFL